MASVMIKDLPSSVELDGKAMGSVRGGCGLCALAPGMPHFSSSMPNFAFDASQLVNQSQNVVNNNGNNAAFVGAPAGVPGQSPAVKTNALKF